MARRRPSRRGRQFVPARTASREFPLHPCDKGQCATNDLVEPTGGDRHGTEFAAPAVIEEILAGNFLSSARHAPFATVSVRGTYGRESSIIAED
jgi:hypothetical protein